MELKDKEKIVQIIGKAQIALEKLDHNLVVNTGEPKGFYISLYIYNFMQQILHYPTLKTVLTIEKNLQEADTVVSKSELKRRLPTQIMHQTLNLILDYLEKSGKIIIGPKGITWIYNENPKFKKLLKKAVRVA